MKQSVQNPSRRLFLGQSAAVSALGLGATPFALNLAAMGSAAAATASGYKALVCIYLQGGNDGYNTVLATDSPSWSVYEKVRKPSPIALARNSVLNLSPTHTLKDNRTLALHPQLAGLQNLFNNQRRLAIVSNVGPLIEPLSKDEYNRKLKRQPQKLFSHNDQQSTWQALAPEGATMGWGGRLADAVAGDNGNGLFTGISAAGNSVWVSGQSVKQYQLQPGGTVRLGLQTNAYGTDAVFGSSKVGAALQRIVTGTRGTQVFEADLATTAARSIQAETALRNTLPSNATAPYGPDSLLMYTKPDGSRAINPLAQQLQVVARAIGARNNLSMKRQVFYVSLGGCDTHDEQFTRQADLMARLNHAMVYFDTVLMAIGASGDVTTFTASDFGRTFTSNGDGTDHGWGSHHFVMGGAVRGGAVVGDLPEYSVKNATNNNFDGSPDQIANGAMLPKIAVEQYAGALGKWFGADTALNGIFPNLRNFSALNLMA